MISPPVAMPLQAAGALSFQQPVFPSGIALASGPAWIVNPSSSTDGGGDDGLSAPGEEPGTRLCRAALTSAACDDTLAVISTSRPTQRSADGTPK
jgi:hypothetical protein